MGSTWICHYEPESRRQFVEWKHADSLVKKTFLGVVVSLLGHEMIHDNWFSWKKCAAVNCASYCLLLWQHSSYLNDPRTYIHAHIHTQRLWERAEKVDRKTDWQTDWQMNRQINMVQKVKRILIDRSIDR